MSWCDKLSSTPIVGFRFDWHFVSGDDLLASLASILDSLPEGDQARFSVEKHSSFETTFTTDDGFQYAFNPRAASVGFQHKLRVKAVGGGPPVMEMLSKPAPFTKLLPEVERRLIEATLLLPGSKSRKLNRIGIVAATRVSFEDAPPGIRRFIDYVGRPWRGEAKYYSFQITADLSKNSETSDRCVHLITRNEEDQEQLVSMQFDWQRAYNQGRALTADTLKALLANAEKSAMTYFEELAEGIRFDENIRGLGAT